MWLWELKDFEVTYLLFYSAYALIHKIWLRFLHFSNWNLKKKNVARVLVFYSFDCLRKKNWEKNMKIVIWNCLTLTFLNLNLNRFSGFSFFSWIITYSDIIFFLLKTVDRVSQLGKRSNINKTLQISLEFMLMYYAIFWYVFQIVESTMQIVCNYVFLQGTYSVAHQRCPIRWTTLAGHPVEKEAVFHKKHKSTEIFKFRS